MLICPPLNISKTITARKLKVGTTTAISNDVIPIASSPNKEITTGIPNKTKLLLKIVCINTPLLAFSFSINGIIIHINKQLIIIELGAKIMSLILKTPSKLVLYTL